MQTQTRLSEAAQLGGRSRRRWTEVAVQVTDATGGRWRCSSSSLVPSGAEGGRVHGDQVVFEITEKKAVQVGEWGCSGGTPPEHPHFSYRGDPVTFGAPQTPKEPTGCVTT